MHDKKKLISRAKMGCVKYMTYFVWYVKQNGMILFPLDVQSPSNKRNVLVNLD